MANHPDFFRHACSMGDEVAHINRGMAPISRCAEHAGWDNLLFYTEEVRETLNYSLKVSLRAKRGNPVP
jgi:hypothetical protein